MRLAAHIADKFRRLADKGFGDDVIYDAAGSMWVVFRVKSFEIHVKSISNRYADVKVVKP